MEGGSSFRTGSVVQVLPAGLGSRNSRGTRIGIACSCQRLKRVCGGVVVCVWGKIVCTYQTKHRHVSLSIKARESVFKGRKA